MQLRSADFQLKNVFDRKIRRKLALRSGTLFASNWKVHSPRFHSHATLLAEWFCFGLVFSP